MKVERTVKYKLSLEEVKAAINHYLHNIGETPITIDKIDPVIKSEPMISDDPHDCDYIEIFNGLEVTGTAATNKSGSTTAHDGPNVKF